MDPLDYHVHSFGTRTSLVNCHIHCMSGVTGPTVPYGNSHVHYYSGVTTFDDGHVHCFSGCTGPSIPCPNGGHIHCMYGCTTVDHYHSHAYGTYTGNEESSGLFRRHAI
jgi:hypothetical protein